jgi:ABC-2 type transport system permease protein
VGALSIRVILRDAIWIAEKEFRQFLGRVPIARLTVTIIVPIMLLLVLSFRVGGVAPQNVHIAVVDHDDSQYSAGIVNSLITHDRFAIITVTNRTQAVALIDSGIASAAIVIPSDFSRNIAIGRPVSVELILDDSNPFYANQIYSRVVNDIRAVSGSILPEPVTTTSSFVYGAGFGFENFIAPGIVAMTAMFGTSFQAISVVWERTLGTFDRIRATPVAASSVVLGKILAGSMIGIVQAVVVLVFAHFVFGTIVRNVYASILVVFLVAFIFTGIGVTVSTLVKEPRGAIAINQLINWPMVLISGVFYPVQALPDLLRLLASLLPLTYATEALRAIMIKGHTLLSPGLGLDIGVLLLYATITLVVGSNLLFRILRR